MKQILIWIVINIALALIYILVAKFFYDPPTNDGRVQVGFNGVIFLFGLILAHTIISLLASAVFYNSGKKNKALLLFISAFVPVICCLLWIWY